MSHFRAVISVVALVFMPLPLWAQGSLFDQGKSFLDSFSPGGGTSAVPGLSDARIADGLKEALRVGADRVVSTLGRVDAFNKDASIHIPLPSSLAKVQSTLGKFGMSGLADDLELRLNRAAESAVPAAKSLFGDAVSRMTLDDVQKIYKGPSDAATRYFQDKMSGPLSVAFRPIIERELGAAGAIAAYDKMMSQYKSLPFVSDVKTELSGYVLDKSLAAVFSFLAREEKAIRENPAKRTTELLRQVFGK